MNLINFIIECGTIHSEWIIGIVSMIIGSLLAITGTILWDDHKNKKRHKNLLKVVFLELKENQKRMSEVIGGLPKEIKEKIDKGDINKSVPFSENEISKLDWSFPRPYSTDAWKTFVLSGFATNLSPVVFQKLYKAYDCVNSVNFLGNLSVSIFQILVQQNKLDEQTNKNFDQFCKFGVRSQEIIGSKIIKEAVDELDKITN